MKEHTVTTYSFSELSPEAKQKALDFFSTINTDYDWWHFEYEFFHEQLKAIGLKCKTFYFGLDRDYFITPDKLEIFDHKLFIEKSSQRNHKHTVKLSIQTIRNTITVVPNEYDTTLDRLPRYKRLCYSVASDADSFLNNLLSDFLNSLRNQYEYLVSEEAIQETIECNDYEFTENGKLFTNH